MNIMMEERVQKAIAITVLVVLCCAMAAGSNAMTSMQPDEEALVNCALIEFQTETSCPITKMCSFSPLIYCWWNVIPKTCRCNSPYGG